MSGEDKMLANCTCTLLKGKKNIIIDTMTPWDKLFIEKELKKYHLHPDNIDYVISTHGHSDHIGNNNLFLKAIHIVGFSVSNKYHYFLHPFDKGVDYTIDAYLKIVPTPGHTLSDISVVANVKNKGTVVVAGDLFEKPEDIQDSSIWLNAGSEAPDKQRKHRYEVATIADYIVPGHGDIFQVTPEIKKLLHQQLNKLN